MENIYTEELRKLVAEIPNTSAWKRGVKEYTDELLDNLEEMAQNILSIISHILYLLSVNIISYFF